MNLKKTKELDLSKDNLEKLIIRNFIARIKFNTKIQNIIKNLKFYSQNQNKTSVNLELEKFYEQLFIEINKEVKILKSIDNYFERLVISLKFKTIIFLNQSDKEFIKTKKLKDKLASILAELNGLINVSIQNISHDDLSILLQISKLIKKKQIIENIRKECKPFYDDYNGVKVNKDINWDKYGRIMESGITRYFTYKNSYMFLFLGILSCFIFYFFQSTILALLLLFFFIGSFIIFLLRTFTLIIWDFEKTMETKKRKKYELKLKENKNELLFELRKEINNVLNKYSSEVDKNLNFKNYLFITRDLDKNLSKELNKLYRKLNF